jgi:hypothetical protein
MRFGDTDMTSAQRSGFLDGGSQTVHRSESYQRRLDQNSPSCRRSTIPEACGQQPTAGLFMFTACRRSPQGQPTYQPNYMRLS